MARPQQFPIAFLAACFVAVLLALTPRHAAAQSFGTAFGAATAVAGDYIVVGEPNSVRRPGIVYLYRAGDDAWSEAGRLTAPGGTAGDRFGEAIDFDGSRMIIGASRAGDGRGAAYVFEIRDDGWEHVATLTVPGGAGGDQLGVEVAVEGDLALVGTADGELLSMGGIVEGFLGPAQVELDAPAVHAFRRAEDGTWRHAGRLSPGEGLKGIGFGHALAIREGTAFVGAAKHQGSAGAVFVYEAGAAPDGAWTRGATITGEVPGAGLGAAVALDQGGRLLAGAPMQDNQQGQVIVFERDETTGAWTETARLRPEGQVAHFGASLATDGSAVWIGALGGAFTTQVDASGGGWTPARQLAIERSPGTEFFASEVGLAGGVGTVGFPEDAFGAGTATVLTRDSGADGGGDGWRVAGQVLGESDAPPAIAGGEVRCEEGSAEGYGCQSVDLLSFVPVTDLGSAHGVHVNDIWGWTDPETGREWALVGRADGTAFVDVTDADNPVYVAELPRTEGSPVAGWRDVKTYRDYALIVADASGQHGMQVFDLKRLRDVDASTAPATLAPDATYDGFGSSHNVIVNEESGFAYAVSAECGGGLHMIDLADPLNPAGAGCYTNPGNTPLESMTHDSQCVAYIGPDADYRGRDICFTSGFAGLLISDMSDRDSPATLGVGKVPNSALPHQGWLTEDQRYFLLGDEGDEIQGTAQNTRTLIWDVTQLDDPVLLTEYFGPTKAIDHNMYVRGNLVYQANYDAGLRVIDISDIANPREVGHFDTVPGAPDEATFRLGAWSVYPYFESGTLIVSSGTEGLFVLRYTPEPVS